MADSTMIHSLAPSLLLSMPQLIDRNFNRTVVLLCKHSDEGAFGLVVNRPMVTTGRVVVNLDPPVSPDRDLQIWIGGPVEPQRSWILVGDRAVDEDEPAGVRIADALYLSTSPDPLGRVAEPDPPPRVALVVGYSGWGPGQVEGELQASGGLIRGGGRDLIFNPAAEGMGEAAIRRLGADPAALQTSRGVH